MLFKKWIKKENIKYWKINMKPSLLKKSHIPDNIIKDYFWPNTNLSSNNQNPNTNQNNQNHQNSKNNNNKDQQNTKNNQNPNSSTNLSNFQKDNLINQNPNFQIWNICSNSNNKNFNNNQKENTSYSSVTPPKSWSSLNPSNSDSQWFDVFKSNGNQKWALITTSQTGLNNLLNPVNNLSNTAKQKIKALLEEGKPVCWADNKNILSVCLQLIPSWPRWPVGGTTRVNSVKDIITMIDNVLKDIKQSFIIPAGHWDEALDIDFKHIKFDKIIAFDIVLQKKPVFQYKRNQKEKLEQENKPDTQNLEDTPRQLANIYTAIGIANANSKYADTQKYLFTNLDNAKLSNWSNGESNLWKKNTNQWDWRQTMIEDLLQFVDLNNKMFKNLYNIINNFYQASQTLVAKSK